MTFIDDHTIESLTLRLLDRTLLKKEWTHAAHFAAALWLSRHRPDLAMPDAMRAIICGYNESVGGLNSDTAGYHHSITIASMAAAAHHLSRHAADTPLHVVLSALLASREGARDWPLDHWRRETLFAVAARRGWVAPDLAPLPFAHRLTA